MHRLLGHEAEASQELSAYLAEGGPAIPDARRHDVEASLGEQRQPEDSAAN